MKRKKRKTYAVRSEVAVNLHLIADIPDEMASEFLGEWGLSDVRALELKAHVIGNLFGKAAPEIYDRLDSKFASFHMKRDGWAVLRCKAYWADRRPFGLMFTDASVLGKTLAELEDVLDSERMLMHAVNESLDGTAFANSSYWDDGPWDEMPDLPAKHFRSFLTRMLCYLELLPPADSVRECNRILSVGDCRWFEEARKQQGEHLPLYVQN